MERVYCPMLKTIPNSETPVCTLGYKITIGKNELSADPSCLRVKNGVSDQKCLSLQKIPFLKTPSKQNLVDFPSEIIEVDTQKYIEYLKRIGVKI